MHFIFVNILLDIKYGKLGNPWNYVDVLKMTFPVVSILRAQKSVLSAISSHSQSFLSRPVGAALCLPLMLEPLVPTKATNYLLHYKSLPTTNLWSWWSTDKGFQHVTNILVNLAFTHLLLSLGFTARRLVLGWKTILSNTNLDVPKIIVPFSNDWNIGIESNLYAWHFS